MADEKWIRQDASEPFRDWLLFLPIGARLAWVCLKSYVKQAAYSQKRPNIAVSLSVRVAGHQWNIPVADVEAMIAAAMAEGELLVSEGEWTVTDERGFVSEKTIGRRGGHLSDKRGQMETNEDTEAQNCKVLDLSSFVGQTGTDGDKRGQPCHVTETETETETVIPTDSLRSSVGGAAAPSGDSGGQKAERGDPKQKPEDFLIGLLPESHRTDELVQAIRENFQMRRERRRKPLTETSLTSRAKEYAGYPPEIVVAALREATTQGWDGVFPAKIARKAANGRASESMDEQYRRLMIERGEDPNGGAVNAA